MPSAAGPNPDCIRDFLRYMTKQLETAERLADDEDLIDGTFGNLFESVAKSLSARRRTEPSFASADLEQEVMRIMNGLLDAVPDRPGIADFFLSYMEYDRAAAMNLRRVLDSMAEPRDVAELLDLVAEAARGLDAAGDITSQPYREGLAILCRSCSSPNGIQGTWYQLKILREAVEAGGGAGPGGQGWRRVAGLERAEPAGEAIVRGMDIELAPDHPGFPAGPGERAGGRLLEVKSGPRIDGRQAGRHFRNHSGRIGELRFVVNATDEAQVTEAARELWDGIGQVFSGDAGAGVPGNPALAGAILRDAGVNIPAAQLGNRLAAAPQAAWLGALARAFIIRRRIVPPIVR
jgi:hypothetical protein